MMITAGAGDGINSAIMLNNIAISLMAMAIVATTMTTNQIRDGGQTMCTTMVATTMSKP